VILRRLSWPILLLGLTLAALLGAAGAGAVHLMELRGRVADLEQRLTRLMLVAPR
jgi:hypothetical protein